MGWFYDQYLPQVAARYDWRASPLRAATLEGVAPAMVVTAGFDPLRDEGRAYARRLEWLRVGLTLAFALVTYLLWPVLLFNIAVALAGYAAISALAFAFEAFRHDNDRNAARAFS
jgi:acetyl esterase/lipase